MTARIDGVAWAANAAISGGYVQNISLALVGGDIGLATVITLSVGGVTGPGVYQVRAANSPASTFAVGTLQVASAVPPGRVWSTAFTGGTGSVTITAVTAAGASGTFTFTLGPDVTTGASGNKLISEGVFNVVF
jgi:hypothetical protein